MARVIGGGHSDSITGNLNGTCFRGYRGNGIASGTRRFTVAKPKTRKIDSPREVPGLVARFTADQLVTLRNVPLLAGFLPEEESMIGLEENGLMGGTDYVESWGDQVGRIGSLVQATANKQPIWYSADPERNNKPYIQGDGINDILESAILPLQIPQPFSLWLVGSEPELKASAVYMIRISDVGTGNLSRPVPPPDQYYMRLGNAIKVSDLGDMKVKLWRAVYDHAASFLEWNNVRQQVPRDVGNGYLKQMRLFGYSSASNVCKFKCFEIDVFEGILSPIWLSLLWSWFKAEYNLPA
jgi:hypothetical protein